MSNCKSCADKDAQIILLTGELTGQDVPCPLCDGKVMGDGEFCPVICREGKLLPASAQVVRNVMHFVNLPRTFTKADVEVAAEALKNVSPMAALGALGEVEG